MEMEMGRGELGHKVLGRDEKGWRNVRTYGSFGCNLWIWTSDDTQ